MDRSLYSLPLFDDDHRAFASALLSWASQMTIHEGAVDDSCRSYVKELGEAGWLDYTVPVNRERIDVRSLCIARETIGYHSAIAEFSFAMQGLGAGPISLYGSPEVRERYLPRVASGDAIPAFAISEAGAGSDVAAMTTTARRDGDAYIIDGEKTWISNAGIADFYVVFARLDDSYVAIVVESGDKGVSVTERFDMIAPHPIGTIRFDSCRVPADRVVGEPGRGLRVALGTLDVFRTTVGAAALGFARRALDEAVQYSSKRGIFGAKLSDLQLTRAAIAEMATEIDASALLVYRSAWKRDNGAERVTREAAMAKMYATEAAQRVIDRAVQIVGARGVVAENVVERLYREIRSLRIYEGATEVQKLVIAGQVLKNG
ncbi:MAG TPA: acyl-CoA dehydrogenase family protein [Gemmatimonadaceae bacterium]